MFGIKKQFAITRSRVMAGLAEAKARRTARLQAAETQQQEQDAADAKQQAERRAERERKELKARRVRTFKRVVSIIILFVGLAASLYGYQTDRPVLIAVGLIPLVILVVQMVIREIVGVIIGEMIRGFFRLVFGGVFVVLAMLCGGIFS
jgi:hypothetical protein